jgi:ABC-type nickel/cobalt efflux system permease component RcnA
MGKYSRIFGITVALLFILLGVYVLLGSRFKDYSQEVRIIFAVFLFLYGAWRMTRYIFKNREKE